MPEVHRGGTANPPGRPPEEEELLEPTRPGGTNTSNRKVNDSILPDLDAILPKRSGSETSIPKIPDRPPPPPPPVVSRPAEQSPPKKTDPKPDVPASADGQIPAALLTNLKAATVFIKVRTNEVSGSGSGFVLRVKDDTAWIVTNQHVAQPKSQFGIQQNAEHEVVFHSGRKNEFSRKARLVAADPDHDLAIRRSAAFAAFVFPERSPPIGRRCRKRHPSTSLSFGQRRPRAREQPGHHHWPRHDSSLVRTGRYGVHSDRWRHSGNSGGPVGCRGRLVGVEKAAAGHEHQLRHPRDRVDVTQRACRRTGVPRRQSWAPVEMDHRQLIDPLIGSSRLHFGRPVDGLKDKPTVGSDGKWSALSGGSTQTCAWTASRYGAA